jgi:hypothetical protein
VAWLHDVRRILAQRSRSPPQRVCPDCGSILVRNQVTVMKFSAAALALLLLAACKPATATYGHSDPSDPASPVSPVTYRSSLGSYASQRPVSPADWRQQNERVAPQPRGAQ